MPWSEVGRLDQRRRFVEDAQLGVFSLSELRRRYAVSRPTGYLWLERFPAGGVAVLADRSHAPHRCPHATPPHIWEAVRAARHQHPSWGPKTLLWLVSGSASGPSSLSPATPRKTRGTSACTAPPRRRPRARPKPPEYPGHCAVRRVSRNGGIRSQSKRVPVSQELGGALEP